MNSRTKKILRENLSALGFLAPAGVIILTFWLLPVVLAFMMSFTNFESGDAFFDEPRGLLFVRNAPTDEREVDRKIFRAIRKSVHGDDALKQAVRSIRPGEFKVFVGPTDEAIEKAREALEKAGFEAEPEGVSRWRYSYVGADNYKRLFDAESGHWNDFRKVLYNTLNYVLWSVPLTIACGLGLAMLLNNKLKGIGLFRTLYFLPHVTTWVAIAIIWKLIYNEQLGLANYFLTGVFGMEAQKWLAEPRGVIEMLLSGLAGVQFSEPLHPLLAGPSLSMFCIIITSVWYDTGYFVIIFLAGLQNIDASSYEAAEIDGANAWQKFVNITVPLLSPVLFFLLVISMINAFKVFIPMFIMTPTGGPDQSTLTMVFFLYNKAFANGKLGYGAAIAFVLLLIILAATLVQRYVIGRKVHYN